MIPAHMWVICGIIVCVGIGSLKANTAMHKQRAGDCFVEMLSRSIRDPQRKKKATMGRAAQLSEIYGYFDFCAQLGAESRGISIAYARGRLQESPKI
jgi:hypothetical protein